MIIVLLGPPGGGKGTQAVGLAESWGAVHLSTGDLLRRNLQERTPLGVAAESFMSRGELVPDEVVIGMVRDRLSSLGGGAAVLDGFPRTVAQAEALDAMVAELGLEAPQAVLLDVPRDSLLRRLTGRRVCRAHGHPYHVDFMPPQRESVCDVDGSELYQRADDTLATVSNRLDVYQRETAPVIGYFGDAGRLVEVDGDGRPDDVGARLRDAAARFKA